MKFHSPYQFIPVDTRKARQTHSWQPSQALKSVSKHIRHDYWAADHYSGRIHCLLRCCSPLVVGAEQQPGSKTTPGTVKPYRLPGNPNESGSLAIPANSLRGMLSSVVETISQSALRVLVSEKDSDYSYRKFARKNTLKKIGIFIIHEGNPCIYPLNNEYIPFGNYQTRDYALNNLSCYQHKNNPDFVYFSGERVRTDRAIGTKGIVYIRGYHNDMPNKKHETFIPWEGELPAQKYVVPASVIEHTERMLRRNHKDDFPQLPKGYQRDWKNEKSLILQHGDLMYYHQTNGVINELSYSAIWRSPVKGDGLYQAFKNSGGDNAIPWGAERTELTPAEALFGVVEEQPEKDARNLASRVRLSEGLPQQPVKLMPSVILKILASPKPPSPSMYFRDAAKGYIAKQALDLDRHIPNGRKHYLPQPKEVAPWASAFKPEQSAEHNFKPHLQCRPIPEQTEFEFCIDYDNLTAAELGLLRTALEPSQGFIHRLGLGKPLGLGQVDIKITRIEKIDRSNRYRQLDLQAPRFAPESGVLDSSLVDPDALALLATLSDPKNLQYPVSYPFASSQQQGPGLEDKGFEWFGENDNLDQHQQVLPPPQIGQALPALESSHARLEIPLTGMQKKLPPHVIATALKQIAPGITINHVSKKGGQTTVYLGSNKDLDRLKNTHGDIQLTLAGKTVTATPRPQT